MSDFEIRIAAVASSLVGTLLLAIRVKRILTALSLVARVHEKNFDQRASAGADQVVFTGSTEHLKRAESRGFTLLVLGFALLIFSAVLNGYALYLDRPAHSNASAGAVSTSHPVQSETNHSAPPFALVQKLCHTLAVLVAVVPVGAH